MNESQEEIDSQRDRVGITDLLSRLVLEHGIEFRDCEPPDDCEVWMVLQEYDPGEFRIVMAIWSAGYWWEIDGEEDVYGEGESDSESWMPVKKLEAGISRMIWHQSLCDNDSGESPPVGG